ncbi:uncharacterized protein V3H82_010828 [Fundulus diaphanus]
MTPEVKSGFLVLVLLVLGVGAQDETKYFEIGGTLVLDPKVSETLTSLTWKHKGNIVAEWIKDVIEMDYLGDFKGRSQVDQTTGVLTIRGIKKAEEGEFRVEINGRERPGTFKAVGIRSLKGVQVEVAVRPLTCSAASETCNLDCRGDFTDTGPVRFFWKKGDTGRWEEMQESTITIFNNEEAKKIESFRCKASNPLGETEESKAEKNPLTQEASGGGSGVGIGVGIALPVLVVVVGAILLLYFKWWLPRRHATGQSNKGHEAGPGDNGVGPSSAPMLMEEGKGQTGAASADPKSVDAQNPREADAPTGDVSTVYSAVGSFNPGDADQSAVPNATGNSEDETEHEKLNNGS